MGGRLMNRDKKRLVLILVIIFLLAVILSLFFIFPLFDSGSGLKDSEFPAVVKNPGWLTIEGADIRGHDIINSETGKQVGLISPIQRTAELPPGTYHVTAGGAGWKNVQVREGETIVLKPGVLTINNASLRGHSVLEPETGEEHGLITNLAGSLTLIPGKYRVTFGSIHWDVEILEGRTLIINPGVVTVEGASYKGHTIHTQAGKEIGYVSNTAASMTLPPGDYTISVGGETVAFTLKEGQQLKFSEK